MGKKKVHSGCIYVKYIYFTKFSKVPLLKIILAPLATLFILQSRYFKPWHCSRCCAFLPSLAFTPELLMRLCGDTLTNSSDHILLLLQPEGGLKHSAISSSGRWYLWFLKIVWSKEKGFNTTGKPRDTKKNQAVLFGISWDFVGCGLGVSSLWGWSQWALMFSDSCSCLCQDLRYERRMLRDALGLQTGSVHWALKHLPKQGGHWRAVQD